MRLVRRFSIIFPLLALALALLYWQGTREGELRPIEPEQPEQATEWQKVPHKVSPVDSLPEEAKAQTQTADIPEAEPQAAVAAVQPAASADEWGGPALPENGGREIFQGEVLDVHSEPMDVPGHFRRTRLIKTEFHYPLVRVEETVVLDAEQQKIEIVEQEGVVADHLLVRRHPEVDARAFIARVEAAGFPVERKMRTDDLYRLRIPARTVEDLPAALAELKEWQSDLLYAEADPIVFLTNEPLEPNDPAYLDGRLWGQKNTGQNGGTAGKDINAAAGWSIRTDTGNLIIGVVDSGIQFDHEDLAANMWVNPDSTAPPSQTHGYDALSSGLQAPIDQNRHGTHVAGTIGAVGNNDKGVVGAAWDTQMMALKFVGSSSGGTISDAVDAIDFGIDNGVSILSNSWGGGGFSQTLFDAVERANQADVIFLAAAGNNGADSAIYPAGYPLPNVVAVASYDRNGQRSDFSNYSASQVHIAAPGDGIYSTSIDPGDLSKKNMYENLSGTSMATPQVAGIVGLMRAQFPSEGAVQIINRLLAEADRSIMPGEVMTGGADLGASLVGAPAGPMNDHFVDARDLGKKSITTLGNISLATAEAGEPAHGGVPADQSVWFTWESSFDRGVDVRVALSDFSPVVTVYTGTGFGDLTEVASASTDPAGEVDAALSFAGVDGQSYYVVVDTADGAEGSFRLTVESTPDNNSFENAALWTGSGSVFQTNNFGASKAFEEARHGGVFGGASLWYQYTPTMDGRLSVRNGNGSAVDLGISIYSGAALVDLVEIDGVRSTKTERQAARGFLEAGETYHIAVDTVGAAENNFFIDWSFASNSIGFTQTEVTVTDSGGSLTIPVKRLSGLAMPPESSVEWFTTSASAGAVPGEDYLSESGTLTWSAGETGEKSLSLTILEHVALRGEREFFVGLRNPDGGAYLHEGQEFVRVRITDSEDPLVELPGKDSLFYFAENSFQGYTLDGQIWLSVRRSGNLNESDTVTLTPVNGTASAGNDFAGDAWTVTFAPDEQIRWVGLPILPGADAGEFPVALSNPSRSASAVSSEQGAATVEILPVGAPLYEPLRRLTELPLSPGAVTVFDADLEGLDMSDNGRFVVFATSGEPDTSTQVDAHTQVYLYDAVTGAFRLLSRDPMGLPGNDDSLRPTISGDGRYVIFETVATNLLEEDPNGPIRDIVLLDRLRGTREAVNVNTFGDLAQIQFINLDEPLYIDSESARISKDGSAVVFVSRAQNLEVNHPNEWWDDKLYVRDLDAGTTEIVSVGNNWFHTRGIAEAGSISRDGQTVAFSFKGPLTERFTGLVSQVYVRDRSSSSTFLASEMSDGSINLDIGQMSSVVLSGDGSKVFFRTMRFGFAGDEDNRSPSLYRHDRDSGTTVLADTGSDGVPADGGIAIGEGVVASSEDGERVAFASNARNLFPGTDSGTTPNVFFKDLMTGAVAPVSTRVDASLSPGAAEWIGMDRTGEALVFFSNKTGLINDAEEGWHIYGTRTTDSTDEALIRFDTDNLTITRAASGGQTVDIVVRRLVDLTSSVSVSYATADGTAVAGVDYSAVSGTLSFGPGETVKTISVDLLDPADSSVTRDFSLSLSGAGGALRLIAPDTVLVTVEGVPDAQSALLISSRDGVSADRESRPVSISRDGGKVAFGTLAGNLSALDDSSRNKVLVRDVDSASLSLHAKEDASVPGDGSSYRPVLSPEGGWVAFHSQARNLVSPTITDSRLHLFLENLATGDIFLLSQNAQGDTGDANTTWWDESVTFTGGFQEVRVPGIAVSENADWVAFHSEATNLVAESTSNDHDIFLWERATGNLSRISSGAGGDSRQPVITPDGRYVAYISDKTDLVSGETNSNGLADVFRYDRSTGETIRINLGPGGAEADGRSYSVAISADGDTLAFDSLASNLVAGDSNGTVDVFVHTVSTGITERVSVSSSGEQATAYSFSDALPDAGHSLQPSLSEDGRFVSFHSNALGLVAGVSMPDFTFSGETAPSPTHKLYVHDRQSGETESVIPVEPEADGFEAEISGDGQFIAFLSTNETMLDTETGTRRMVYRFPNPLADTTEPTGFAAWRTDRFGSDAEDDNLAGPAADANGDGIPNLLKYLWGQDPLDHTAERLYSSRVMEASGERFLAWTLWVDPTVEDISWGIEVSGELDQWEALPPGEYSETQIGSENGLNQLELRPDQAMGEQVKQFYRLVFQLE